MTSTATIKITASRPKDFQQLVAWVKAAGATFNGATKTWTLELDEGQTAMQALNDISGSRAAFYASDMTISEA